MEYVHINVGPNRHMRRRSNAIARRNPTDENLKANDLIAKMPRNKPYRKPKKEQQS